jgi:O-antigen/teichoic acid export membrane protein
MRPLVPFLKSLFGRAGDTTTADGRSAERLRRVTLTALAAGGGKVVAVLTLMVTVSLTLGYLGEERYGLWMVLASIITMFGVADFGLGYGVLNKVAAATGTGDNDQAAETVSNGWFLLLGIAALLGVAFLVSYGAVDWASLYRATSAQAAAEAAPATAVLVVCFLLGLPLTLVQRLREAYQEGYVNALWTAGGALVSLGALVAAVWAGASLPWLVATVAVTPLLSALGNGIALVIRRPWLRPRWAVVRSGPCRAVLTLGLLFLALQVEAAVTFGSDGFIAARVLGPAAAAQLSVPARLFSFPVMLLTIVVTPLWPAYGEAVTRGEVAWVRAALRRSVILTLVVVGVAAVALVVTARPLITVWVGYDMRSSWSLIAALGVYTIFFALSNALATFLNATNALKFQVICGLLVAVCAVPLKIVLARRYGVSGIVWGTVLPFVLLDVLPACLYVPYWLRRCAAEAAAAGPSAPAASPAATPGRGPPR